MSKRKPAKQSPAKPPVEAPAKAPGPKALPTPAEPSPEERWQACQRDVGAVLAQYRCKIYAALRPMKAISGEPGEPASEAIISAVWGITPEE